ncbi:hypothetical protein TNCV_1188221 [Trichonephila clavipes]|nr:hypothetical protein TNCV_1188221 [Trichonephila clavipes]
MKLPKSDEPRNIESSSRNEDDTRFDTPLLTSTPHQREDVDEFIASTLSITQSMENSLDGLHIKSLPTGGRYLRISPVYELCVIS